ncbi:THAP domain-containing protein 1-like isoform X1 [Chiloscyllium plagiosum]|uniref:THAP domain-containing protein 1-like n=1 Tax=Hemiscyllium ocellatum TaxID=170820 RepID=UPI001CB8432E|nr:THAP domain-containing protein 1-like isoform X1 [Chiloscyllium plagiosum]XP_060707490.1 THAP domain-containing protein 1-like [Hemiscyllium ocellatum]
MVLSCSAYGCKNRYDKDRGVSFHRFPLKRPELCKKWLAAVRRRNFTPTKNSNLCSEHFTLDCFRKNCNNKILEENAVPSIFCFTRPNQQSKKLEIPVTSDQPNAEEISEDTALKQAHGLLTVYDHSYSVGDACLQKKKIQKLEEQNEKLKKKLKFLQQKSRRQEQRLQKMKKLLQQLNPQEILPHQRCVLLHDTLYEVIKV